MNRGDPEHTELMEAHPEEDDHSEIVPRDLAKIDESYGLIAYVPRVSFGTSMEIFYNSFIKKRGKGGTLILTEDIDDYNKKTLSHFGKVIDVRGMTAEDMAEEISRKKFYSSGNPDLPWGFDSLDTKEKLVVNATEPSAEGAMMIIYASLHLGKGREETFSVAGKNSYHPWLKYFTTQIEDKENVMGRLTDTPVYFIFS